GTSVVRKEMGLRLKILATISNPNIAYILMLLGFYGLFFEFTNPGSIFPGVVGGISLILAFYAFQTLPVNYAGLLLIILAVILFVLEVKITSGGILTIGGIIAMIIGSIMLFESPGPFLELSIYLIVPAVLITAFFFSLTVGLAVKAWRRKPVTGVEGLLGLEGVAYTDVFEDGMVLVHGEYWRAYSDEPIKKGEKVIVESVSGLRIKVRKEERK
ncbi:MAG: nodulation protein NfeD, partial [Nitrospirae bacterium]|nr:nodulation protein NfeD [Nitrospirota bacterium]